MSKRQFLAAISIILLFTSCNNNKMQKTVIGIWTIDTIYYKYYDVKLCFLSNSISFNESNYMTLPKAMDDCGGITSNCYDDSGHWEIIKSKDQNDSIPFRLNITSNNEAYNGIHKIIFFRDEVNKLLKMRIMSDSLYLVCRKGLFNFDYNLKLIDELEKMSWTTRQH